MKVVSCNPDQMEVSPHTFNACTFSIIDKWDPKQHAKTCDTMFYLRDGTGAYAWDCDKWIFLDFSGYTSSDWNAKQNQQGYIKNKPFEILGNGLTVSENGELSVNISAEDIGAQRKLTAGAGIVIDESDPEKPTISTDGSTYTTPSGTTGVAIADAKVALQGKNMFSFKPPEDGDAKAVAIVRNNGGSLNVTQLQPSLTAGDGIKIDETNPKAPVLSVKPTEILDQTFDLNLGHGYINVRQRNGVVLLNLVITDAVYQPNTKIYANGDIDDLMRQLFDNPLLERRLERINVYNLQNKTAPNIDSYLIEFSNDGIVFVNDNEVTFQQDELAMITLTMFTG